MNCERAHKEMLSERYVAGRLSEELREEFELHYFDCDQCFAEVAALRAVRETLPAAREHRVETRRQTGKSVPRWAVYALAATVLLALALWPRKDAIPQQALVEKAATPSYAALARFEAPVWNPVLLRESATPARAAFAKAMAFYAAGDYAACARGLDSVEGLTEARYYEGVSLVLAGRNAEGEAQLRKAIAAGDTPYEEEARFYLARTLLGRDGVTEARRELQRVVAMHGDLERKAVELLRQLR